MKQWMHLIIYGVAYLVLMVISYLLGIFRGFVDFDVFLFLSECIIFIEFIIEVCFLIFLKIMKQKINFLPLFVLLLLFGMLFGILYHIDKIQSDSLRCNAAYCPCTTPGKCECVYVNGDGIMENVTCNIKKE